MSAVRAAALAVLLALAAPRPAAAESLVAVTSPATVRIEQDFNGAEITVFGTVERDAVAVSRDSKYEIAVVVQGPEQTVVTRRKDRTLGLWINRASQTFVNVPGFYAALTTTSFDELGTPGALKQKHIGIANVPLIDSRGVKVVGEADEFRSALLRSMRESKRYVEEIGAVTFLTPTLFRSVVSLPANAPIGTYKVSVVLFQGQVPLKETEAFIQVTKTGFEQWMYQLAFRQPLYYGLGTVFVGLIAGWLAAALFRRD